MDTCDTVAPLRRGYLTDDEFTRHTRDARRLRAECIANGAANGVTYLVVAIVRLVRRIAGRLFGSHHLHVPARSSRHRAVGFAPGAQASTVPIARGLSRRRAPRRLAGKPALRARPNG